MDSAENNEEQTAKEVHGASQHVVNDREKTTHAQLQEKQKADKEAKDKKKRQNKEAHDKLEAKRKTDKEAKDKKEREDKEAREKVEA